MYKCQWHFPLCENHSDRGRDIERKETYGIVVLKYSVFVRIFAI